VEAFYLTSYSKIPGLSWSHLFDVHPILWMLASNDAGGLSILGSTVLVSSMYWFCKFTRRLWRLWNCRRLSSVLLTEALFAWGREKLVKTQRSASQGFSNMHCALKACFERYGRTVRIETSIFSTERDMPETQNDALCSEHIVNACRCDPCRRANQNKFGQAQFQIQTCVKTYKTHDKICEHM